MIWPNTCLLRVAQALHVEHASARLLKVGRPTPRDYLTFVKYTVRQVVQPSHPSHAEGDAVCVTTSAVAVVDNEWSAHAKGR